MFKLNSTLVWGGQISRIENLSSPNRGIGTMETKETSLAWKKPLEA